MPPPKFYGQGNLYPFCERGRAPLLKWSLNPLSSTCIFSELSSVISYVLVRRIGLQIKTLCLWYLFRFFTYLSGLLHLRSLMTIL